MRALFDLNHPAQVRFFQHAMQALRADGDQVLVTSRRKDETLPLLDALGVEHHCISGMGRGPAGMAAELGLRVGRMVRLARRFRPDVLVAKSGVTIGIVGRALGVPSVIFDDTEFASLQVWLAAPLATVVCTGMGYGRRFAGKQLTYNAPPHLLYTHPRRFEPDPDRLRCCGVEPDEPFFVMRVKEWGAAHDWGVRGPADDDLRRLVEGLAAEGRPLVTSERALPEGLEPYACPVPVEDALHLLAFARLYVGEGSSMAAEAACLGTPAIYVSPRSRRGYLDALEQRYGLATTVRTAREALKRARALLAESGLAERCRRARDRMVGECEDPLEFMLRVIRRCGRRCAPGGSGRAWRSRGAAR